jgi:hypothetical protein
MPRPVRTREKSGGFWGNAEYLSVGSGGACMSRGHRGLRPVATGRWSLVRGVHTTVGLQGVIS